MEYYLAQWQGSGTKADPFRPVGAAPGVGAVDLRPDSTRVDGYALLSMAVRNDQPKNYYCGNDLNGISPAAKNRIENALGITLASNSFRDIFFELLDPLAGHAKPNDPAWWKPLTITTEKAWELYLNGELVKKVQVVGGGVTDNFTRANESGAGGILSPWVHLGGVTLVQLVSNQMQRPSSTTMLEFLYYTSAASGNNQYSQFKFISMTDEAWGPAVRVSSTGTYSAYVINLWASVLTQIASTAFTDIATLTGMSQVANSTYKISVSGSTVRAYKDGVEAGGSPVTDTVITTGQPGMWIYGIEAVFDDFDGGDLVAADRSATVMKDDLFPKPFLRTPLTAGRLR